jgi:hypothetical protein
MGVCIMANGTGVHAVFRLETGCCAVNAKVLQVVLTEGVRAA